MVPLVLTQPKVWSFKSMGPYKPKVWSCWRGTHLTPGTLGASWGKPKCTLGSSAVGFGGAQLVIGLTPIVAAEAAPYPAP